MERLDNFLIWIIIIFLCQLIFMPEFVSNEEFYRKKLCSKQYVSNKIMECSMETIYQTKSGIIAMERR